MKRKKFNLLLIIFVIILVLGLGYAYLTTTLSINGTTDVDANTWNIYWDNVQVTAGSVSATTPAISNQTTVTFSVHLSQPGDFYEFTVDAKNTGSIDAMIDMITKTTSIPYYLKFTVKYINGAAIDQYQLLNANSTETYRVRVEYKDDIEPEDLPDTAESISLSFGVTYVQATSAAIPIKKYVYVNRYATQYLIGNTINITEQYDNPRDLIDESGHPFFLRCTMDDNDLIEKMDVGYELDGNIYYLIYGEPYETALSNLQNLFNSKGYSCITHAGHPLCETDTIYAEVWEGGTLYAGAYGSGQYWCTIYNNGNTGLCWDD